MKYAPLTSEQEKAILQLVNYEGSRMWKTALRNIWKRALPSNKLETTLYGLRNSHGPQWLSRYRVPVEI
jgi:hypothetical protein